MAFCRVCCLVSGFYFEPVLLKPWKKTALSAWVGEFVVKSLDEVGTSNETTKWPLEGSEARWCAWCKAARKTETSLSWKRKIWSWVGKGFLSTLIRKVCNIGMAKRLGNMQCLSKTSLGLVLHPCSYKNKYLLIRICRNPYLFSIPCA